MPNYRVDYAPKNAAARKRGCVDVSYTITDSPNPTAARRSADESMSLEGFQLVDYKRGKPVEIEGTEVSDHPTAAAQTDDQSALTQQAGGSESVAEVSDQPVEPGHHEQLDQLYGEESQAPVDTIKDVQGSAHLSDTGPEPSIADQVAELNQQIAALGIGERLRVPLLDSAIYHKAHGWGSSRVKDFIKSPALAKPGAGLDKEPTKSMRIGTAYHAASLEPQLFIQRYSDVKASPLKNQGEYDDVIRMRDATLGAMGYLLQGGASEVSYFYRLSERVVLKCRIDYELPGLTLDLKSTADVSDQGIADAVDRFGYALQQEHYKAGSGHSNFAFLFQQNQPPWLTSIPVQLDIDLQEYAQLKLAQIYREIEQCIINDDWPVNRSDSPPDQVKTLMVGLKAWKRRELEQLRMDA